MRCAQRAALSLSLSLSADSELQVFFLSSFSLVDTLSHFSVCVGRVLSSRIVLCVCVLSFAKQNDDFGFYFKRVLLCNLCVHRVRLLENLSYFFPQR